MNKDIKKYLFKNGLPLEFEILDLQKILQSKGDLMTIPHRAQFYHILWIDKGKGTHYIDFEPFKIEDHSIIFIPSNSVNRFDPEGSYQGKVILFTDNFFCKNQQDILYLRSSLLFNDLYPIAQIKINPQHSELKTFLNIIETEYKRSPDTAQYPLLNNLLHIFLLHAEREMRKQGFKELTPGTLLDYLISFKDLLEENFRKEKSVKTYAALINISEKQLHKATSKLVDKTPKQIIDERILLEAKRLLVHSNESVKEIAYDLGYEEPTNFIKYFKKHTNTTPADFREKF